MEENNPNVEQNTNQVENDPVNQTQEVPVSGPETTRVETGTVNTNSTSNTASTENKSLNICCLLSFIFSMVGIVIFGLLCGITATVLGIVGLTTFKPEEQTAKWLGITGLALGAVEFVFMGLYMFM